MDRVNGRSSSYLPPRDEPWTCAWTYRIMEGNESPLRCWASGIPLKKHTLKLIGGAANEVRIPGDLLAEAILALIEGTQRATRLYVEGESLRKGPRPGWLDAACRIEITGLRPGSVEVSVEAPTLQEAVPDRFATDSQLLLFGEATRTLDASQSAVDIFAEVLDSALRAGEDLLADRNLLDSCIRFARASGSHFEGVSLEGLSARQTPVIVRRNDVARIQKLRDETPSPRAVRVSGLLDTISATRPDIILRLPDKSTVPARLEEMRSDELAKLFDKQVVISGMAQFRPSGRLLVIDVEDIALAGETDRIWEQAPRPPPRRQAPVTTFVPQDAESGVAAFFGIWPGSESDDELQRALQDVE